MYRLFFVTNRKQYYFSEPRSNAVEVDGELKCFSAYLTFQNLSRFIEKLYFKT